MAAQNLDKYQNLSDFCEYQTVPAAGSQGSFVNFVSQLSKSKVFITLTLHYRNSSRHYRLHVLERSFWHLSLPGCSYRIIKGEFHIHNCQVKCTKVHNLHKTPNFSFKDEYVCLVHKIYPQCTSWGLGVRYENDRNPFTSLRDDLEPPEEVIICLTSEFWWYEDDMLSALMGGWGLRQIVPHYPKSVWR